MPWDILFKSIPVFRGEGRWRKFIPRLRIILFLGCCFIIAVSIQGIYQGKVSNYILGEISKILNQQYGYEFSFENSYLILPDGIIIKDISLYSQDSILLLRAEEVYIKINVKNIIRAWELENILFKQGEIYLTHRENGTSIWTSPQPSPPITPPPPPGKLNFPNILVENFEIMDTDIYLSEDSILDFQLKLSILSSSKKIYAELHQISGEWTTPDIALTGRGNFSFDQNGYFSGQIEMNSLKSSLISEFNVNFQKHEYSINLHQANVKISEFVPEFSGYLELHGYLSFTPQDSFANFNLIASKIHYGGVKTDSLTADIILEDNVLSANLTLNFNQKSSINSELRYFLPGDSVNYQISIVNFDPQLVPFTPSNYIQNLCGNLNGTLKYLKNLDSSEIYADLSLVGIDHHNRSSHLFGQVNYFRGEDSLNAHLNLENFNPSLLYNIPDSIPVTVNGVIDGAIGNISQQSIRTIFSTFNFTNSKIANYIINSVQGQFNYQNNKLTLSFISQSSDLGDINAQLQYYSKNMDFTATCSNFPLSELHRNGLIDQEISGNLNGTFALVKRTLNIAADIDNFYFQQHRAEKISLSLVDFSISDFSGEQLKLIVDNFQSRGIIFDQIELFARGEQQNWQGSLSAVKIDQNINLGFYYYPQSEIININSWEWTNPALNLHLDNPFSIDYSEGLEIDTISLTGESGVKIKGYFSWLEDSLDGFIQIKSLNIDIVEKFFYFDQDLEGTVSVYSDITGTAQNPHISLRAMMRDCLIEPVKIDSAEIAAIIFNEQVKIDQFEIYNHQEISTIQGTLPLNSEDNIDLYCQFNNIGLWPFEFISDIVSPLNGRIDGNIQVQGTYSDVDINGNLTIDQASIYVIVIGQVVENIAGTLNFSQDTAWLDIKGENNGGDIDMNGFIQFNRNFSSISSRLHFNFNEIAWAGLEGLWANLNGHIDIEIDTFENISIQGDVDINEALIIPPPKTAAPQTGEQELPEMDLFIDGSEGNIWFKSDFADAKLFGNLYISSFNNVIETKGDLEVERGNIFYLDRAFRITEGFIFILSQGDKIDGNVDIKGETTINYTIPTEQGTPERQSATIYVELKGKISAPEFILTSTPKLSQQDIASLLTFNTTWSNISSFSTIAQAVPDRALNYLLRTQILNRLQRTIGLDAIDLETEFGPTNRAKLTLGKYLTNQFYVEYQKDILNDTDSEISLQYNIWKNASVFLNKQQDNIFGLGLRFIWRY
ncbi:MAG: translocation/assembly module TamB domain-containing protein [bacterium]